MPHVTVRYKMHVPAGHHRRPRSNAADLTLAQTAGSDVPNPGNYTPPFFAQLPYDLGGHGLARLLFWNVTDGTHGQVLAPTPFDQTVAENPLTITAWYVPVTGPGVAAPGIICEAFSAALGKFVDDTFVTVTSNPAQTNDAAADRRCQRHRLRPHRRRAQAAGQAHGDVNHRAVRPVDSERRRDAARRRRTDGQGGRQGHRRRDLPDDTRPREAAQVASHRHAVKAALHSPFVAGTVFDRPVDGA